MKIDKMSTTCHHFAQLKKKFPRGTCPQTPLEGLCACDARDAVTQGQQHFIRTNNFFNFLVLLAYNYFY